MLTTFEIKVLETPTDELETLAVDLEHDINNLIGDMEEVAYDLQLMNKRLAAVRQEVDNRMTVVEKYHALFA
jgi:hypothetical protein